MARTMRRVGGLVCAVQVHIAATVVGRMSRVVGELGGGLSEFGAPDSGVADEYPEDEEDDDSCGEDCEGQDQRRGGHCRLWGVGNAWGMSSRRMDVWHLVGWLGDGGGMCITSLRGSGRCTDWLHASGEV